MDGQRFIGRRAALVVSTLATLGVAGVLAATAAGATAAPLQVTLTHSSDGATAVCNNDGSFDLTLGTVTASTFAEADVTSAAGQAPPTVEPVFTTSNFSTGSPRWVIKLSNGKNLQNNQASSTTPASPGQADWQVNLNNVNLTYANALAAAVGTSTGVTVTDAFIVADGDQAPGVDDHITGATYNGQPLTCTTSTSPSPTPSASNSTKPTIPVGGVQTGGGKPGTTNWLPLGVIVLAVGAVAGGGAGATALRRRLQGR